jgi:eukaryotic-like serine/threonine-protein kinase
MKRCPKCDSFYEDVTTLCPSDGTPLEREGDRLIGHVLAGKYRIESRISEGGMGLVYRATHIFMDKELAIKVLNPGLAADEKVIARFSREAKAASRISHPHAVTVTDFGEDENGVVFLAMEYLKGRTLKEVIRTEGPLPLPRVVEIVRQVSSALASAHSMGVVHRDLKSDNIMIEALPGNIEWAKVLDFGIAKIKRTTGNLDSTLTEPNIVIGTPHYMSPEQCTQSSEIDLRSDIYSLGIITYEMLAGHLPFTGDSPTEIMVKHIQEFAPSILEDRPELPSAIDEVITRALAKNPQYRFLTATEFANSFAAAASTFVTSTTTTDKIEDDEPTLIHSRVASPVAPRLNIPIQDVPPGVPAPMPSNFNPKRIAAVGAIILLVVFGGYYAITSMSSSKGSTENESSTVSPADPQSRPVKVIGPPSGLSEKDLTSKVPATNINSNSALPASTPKSSLDDEFVPVMPPGDIINVDTEPTNEEKKEEKKKADNNDENRASPNPDRSKDQNSPDPTPQSNKPKTNETEPSTTPKNRKVPDIKPKSTEPASPTEASPIQG